MSSIRCVAIVICQCTVLLPAVQDLSTPPIPQFQTARGYTFVEVGGVSQYILQMLLTTTNL